MSRFLPARPSLESLHKQAKQLWHAYRSGDPEAQERVRAHHPKPEAFAGLRDAQLALAREYGFAGWGELRDAVEARRVDSLSLAELADEFTDLACLTYSGDEGPHRIARARRLLEQRPDLVEASVFAAAAAGHVAALRRRLDAEPAAVRARGGPRAWSPLLYLAYSRVPDAAPERSALAAAELLLARGADPNDHVTLHDSYRFTVLTGAIGEGEEGLLRQPPHPHARELALRLLDAGADPNDAQGLYNSQFTPGDEWLELLLARGLGPTDPINWRDGYVRTTLDYQLCMAVSLGFEARVDLLLRHGADPDAIDPYNQRSACRNALREGRDAIAALLLAAGARAEALEPEDELHMACRRGDVAAVSRIARDRPELVTNPRLLVDAAQRGDPDVLRALLDAGADPNGRVPGGATALHRAAHHGRLDVAELLLARGAAVGARDEVYDATPVGWANQFGQDALRDHLLDRTCDVFDLASWARVEQLEAVLRADPSLASARRARGRTPLHRLEVGGERGAATIDLLLRHGADIDARADDGRTPLDACLTGESEEIADLLRERGAERK